MNERQQKYYNKIVEIVRVRGGEVLSNYTRMHDYMHFKCSQGHTWWAEANSIISGTWCQECYGNTKGQGKRNFYQRVEARGGKVIGEYVDSKTQVAVLCEYGHIWKPIPNNISGGKWCSVCGYIDNEAKDRFYQIVNEKGGKVIGEYISAKNYIIVICAQNHQWSVKPYCINAGQWCRVCAGLDSDMAAEDLYDLVKRLGGYVKEPYCNCKTKITFVCAMGHEWRAEPRQIKGGTWCDICSRFNHVSEQEIIEIVRKNRGVIVTPYVNISTEMEFICEYGHHWITKPKNIKGGSWCHVCHEPKGEREIRNVLTALGIVYRSQFRHPHLNHRKYDFIFIYQNKKYIVEFDGEQHFKFIPYFHQCVDTFIHKQEIDKIKTWVVLNDDYNIIRIDYTQRNNIEFHIKQAISSNEQLYVSTPELYDWFIGATISAELLERELRVQPLILTYNQFKLDN
jgi:hypothetical protein